MYITCPFRDQMNFQVVLSQATRAGASKAVAGARTTADRAAAANPVPGWTGAAASGGTTEAGEAGRPGGKRQV